jgi:hypothetical protein
VSTANREWQSFSRRWSAWRWLAFGVVVSLGIHAGLAALGDTPLTQPSAERPQAVSDEIKPAPRAVETRPIKAPQARKPSVEQIERFKQQIAAGELRAFFDGLIGEALQRDDADALWPKMTLALNGDLDDLARVVLSDGDVDERRLPPLAGAAGSAVAAAALLQRPETVDLRIKARLVEALSGQLARERNQILSDDLLRQARNIARELAEYYKKQVADRYGGPVGDRLNQMREKDSSARIHDLELAEAAFAQAIRLTRQAAETHEGLDAPLKKAETALQAARDANNKVAADLVSARLHELRPTFAAAHALINKATQGLDNLIVRLAEQPGIGPYVDEALKKLEAAQTGAYAAGQSLGNVAIAKVRELAQQAAERGRAAAAQSELARAAVLLQLLREQADQLHEAAAVAGRQAERIAIAQAEAAGAKDVAKGIELNRELSVMAQQANLNKEAIDRLEARLAKVEPVVKDGGEEVKEFLAKADAARDEMQKAENAMASRQTDAAVANLKRAADLLALLDPVGRALQVKLGVRSAPNSATLARRQIDSMLRTGRLAAPMKELFEKYYRKQIKDKLLKRLDEGIMKRLQVEQALDPVLIDSIHAQLDKLFDRELLVQASVDKVVTATIETKLPPADNAPPEKPDGLAAGPAMQVVNEFGVYALPSLFSGTTYLPGLAKFNAASPKPHRPPGLLLNLQRRQQQLNAGKRDSLGFADLAALAQARAQAFANDAATGNLAEGPPLRPALVMTPPRPLEKLPDHSTRWLPAMPQSNRFAAIPLLSTDAIQIDGNLDDWKDLPFILLDVGAEANPRLAAKFPTQKAWLAYSNQGLLIAVEVNDPTGKIENDKPFASFWTNDAVEVFIDMPNAKATSRSQGDGTHQFFAFPFGHKEDSKSGGFEAGPNQAGKWERTPYPADVIRRAAVKTKTGWSMEMLVPKSLLGANDFKPGQILGFHMQIDAGGDSSCYYYRKPQKKIVPSQRPDIWGDLLLLGTDARIELLDAQGDRLSAVWPGKPFTVRVADFDCNDDNTKREAIAATVRTSSGLREFMVLRETAGNSGVFEATLPTRLSTGVPIPGVLDLMPCEQITIEYLDQVRAFGERDVRLKALLGAGGIGARVAKELNAAPRNPNR